MNKEVNPFYKDNNNLDPKFLYGIVGKNIITQSMDKIQAPYLRAIKNRSYTPNMLKGYSNLTGLQKIYNSLFLHQDKFQPWSSKWIKQSQGIVPRASLFRSSANTAFNYKIKPIGVLKNSQAANSWNKDIKVIRSIYQDNFKEDGLDKPGVLSDLNRFVPNVNTNLKDVIKIIEKLSLQSWCISTHEEIRMILESSPSQNIDKLSNQIYEKNNILEMLDEIIVHFKDEQLLKGGRLTSLKDIRDILQFDSSKYYLFVGDIFAICEYIFFNKLRTIGLIQGNSLKYRYIEKAENHLSALNQYNLSSLRFVSVVKVMEEFWKSTRWSVLTRHTIQHGNYPPENIKKIDFIKVLKLLLSILNLKNPQKILEV